MTRPARTLDELNPEQQAAIRRFAAAHGRGWKTLLAKAWSRDQLVADAVLLRQVRNQFGPRWLSGVRLKLEPTA